VILGPWYHVGDTDEHPNLVAICDECMATTFGDRPHGWDTEEEMIAAAGAQGWTFASIAEWGETGVVACPAHTIEQALRDYGREFRTAALA
jgi:hypothetical protein